jgi:hypothetical protein
VTLDADEAGPLPHHSDIVTAHADDDIDHAGLVIPSPVEASVAHPVSSSKKTKSKKPAPTKKTPAKKAPAKKISSVKSKISTKKTATPKTC